MFVSFATASRLASVVLCTTLSLLSRDDVGVRTIGGESLPPVPVLDATSAAAFEACEGNILVKKHRFFYHASFDLVFIRCAS